MGFILTGSPSGNRTWSSGSHQSGSNETSQLAPIVFVVDGDILVRQSLEALISKVGCKVETFASACEFLARPRSTAPSCLILDVILPDMNGLDLQAQVASERSDMAIVFLTDHRDVATTVKAMQAGAFEFFTKPFRDDILVSAVREALELSRSALAQEAQRRALQNCYACLSLREREVMSLVAYGLSNKQVGGELGISEITVKAHRGRVMQKMNANSLADLVRMSATLGLTRRLGITAHRSALPQWHAEFAAL